MSTDNLGAKQEGLGTSTFGEMTMIPPNAHRRTSWGSHSTTSDGDILYDDHKPNHHFHPHHAQSAENYPRQTTAEQRLSREYPPSSHERVSKSASDGHLRSLSGRLEAAKLDPSSDNSITYSPEPDEYKSDGPEFWNESENREYSVPKPYPCQQANPFDTSISTDEDSPKKSESGRKHRRGFSGGKSHPHMAHRRINSGGNAAFITREYEFAPEYSTAGHSQGPDHGGAWASYSKNGTCHSQLDHYRHTGRGHSPSSHGSSHSGSDPSHTSQSYSRYQRHSPEEYRRPHQYSHHRRVHPDFRSPPPPAPHGNVSPSRYQHGHHRMAFHRSPQGSSMAYPDNCSNDSDSNMHHYPHPSPQQAHYLPRRHSRPPPSQQYPVQFSNNPRNERKFAADAPPHPLADQYPPPTRSQDTFRDERQYAKSTQEQPPSRLLPPSGSVYGTTNGRTYVPSNPVPIPASLPRRPSEEQGMIQGRPNDYRRPSPQSSICSDSFIETDEALFSKGFHHPAQEISNNPRISPQLFEAALGENFEKAPPEILSDSLYPSPITEKHISAPATEATAAAATRVPNPHHRVNSSLSNPGMKSFISEIEKSHKHQRNDSSNSLILDDTILLGETLLNDPIGVQFDESFPDQAPSKPAAMPESGTEGGAGYGPGNNAMPPLMNRTTQNEVVHPSSPVAPQVTSSLQAMPGMSFHDFKPQTPTSAMANVKLDSPSDAGDTITPSNLGRQITGTVSKRTRRKCSIPDCQNRVVQGGLCIAHGAKRKICGHPGCTKHVKKAGMCSAHGPPRKLCEFQNCRKVAVQGGKCIAHGAKKKLCCIGSCKKQAILSGMCKKHHDQQNSSKAQPQLCIPVKKGWDSDDSNAESPNGNRQQSNSTEHRRGLSVFDDINAVNTIIGDL